MTFAPRATLNRHQAAILASLRAAQEVDLVATPLYRLRWMLTDLQQSMYLQQSFGRVAQGLEWKAARERIEAGIRARSRRKDGR